MTIKTVWPGWETVRLIGRGGFGAVYEVQRQVFDEVECSAVKVIAIPQSEGDIEELFNDGLSEEDIAATFYDHLKSIVSEYTLMRKMNDCPNVVSCEDLRYEQHEDGLGWDAYIRMELLTSLPRTLSGAVTEETVVRIARDICTALVECKRWGIVHRDIKPQNIFQSSHGNYKLGDFGIAKTVEKTMGGTKIGTYKFMAPEVYNNQPYGSAADIYSLGMVLYWLLNERRMPFVPLPPEKPRASDEEKARQRRFSGEPLPAPLNGSTWLKNIVLKACAYDPKERFASAQDMLDALAGTNASEVRDDPTRQQGVSKMVPETEAVVIPPAISRRIPEEKMAVESETTTASRNTGFSSAHELLDAIGAPQSAAVPQKPIPVPVKPATASQAPSAGRVPVKKRWNTGFRSAKEMLDAIGQSWDDGPYGADGNEKEGRTQEQKLWDQYYSGN